MSRAPFTGGHLLVLVIIAAIFSMVFLLTNVSLGAQITSRKKLNTSLACECSLCPSSNKNGDADALPSLSGVQSNASAPSASSFLGLLLHASTLCPTPSQPAVVLVMVNNGFIDMAIQQLHQMRQTRPPILNVVFVALDLLAYNVLKRKGVAVYRDENETFDAVASDFRTPSYNQIVIHKFLLLQRALELGFDVLMLDVDVVLLRNPFNYFVDFAKCDVLVTVETLPPGIHENTDQRWSGDGVALWINTGFMFWRNSAPSRTLLHAFARPENRRSGMDDQYEFNQFLKASPHAPEALNLPWTQRLHQCAVYGGVSMHVLSPYLFGSQRHMFEFNLAGLAGTVPYMVHFNWISGFNDKRSRMIANGFWNHTLSDALLSAD
jgi:hypothetical protein